MNEEEAIADSRLRNRLRRVLNQKHLYPSQVEVMRILTSHDIAPFTLDLIKAKNPELFQ